MGGAWVKRLSSQTIAVLAGDGIGPEITQAAVEILSELRPDLNYRTALVGAAAMERGLPSLPNEARALCDASKAILFGSVGGKANSSGLTADRPEQALIQLRREYKLFANLRPVRVFPGLEHASPLKPELIRGIDLMIVRELTGGIYYGRPKKQHIVRGVKAAVDTMRYVAPEIERIARVAFDLARARKHSVTSIDKENVLETSRLWRQTVTDVARNYPDVELRHLLVDNAAMQLVKRPADFDVLLTENMFGDILSDEAAILTGSLGTLPSASLGEDGLFGLFEPIAGSAPDIAEKGIANPTGSILSAAMLLRHALDDEQNARRIEAAVEIAYAEGYRTAEIAVAGKSAVTTEQFTSAVRSGLLS